MLHRTSVLVGVAVALGALSLGGCTDLKRALGMEKVVPDEFAVTTPAPLAIPPDYSLRPPRPGAARPQELSTQEQARQTVFRAGDQQAALPPPSTARSAGESELLREAGAGTAPADIRQIVTVEAEQSPDLSQNFVDKLLFWRKDNSANANLVDPEAEAERLKAQRTAGENITSGPPASLTGTPTITRSSAESSSWLGWLF